MKKLMYLFMLALGVVSCSSNNETTINNSDLVGGWNWTRTDGGIAGHIQETPKTNGKIISLNLMENYEYSVIENGSEITSGIYELTMKKSMYSGEIERFIEFAKNQQYIGIVTKGIIRNYTNNKINIADNNYDGITSEFEKVE
jgi:hypothetical protein